MTTNHFKVCTRCKEKKVLDEFPLRPSRNQHGSQCKDCKRELAREYREKNKERLKEYSDSKKEIRKDYSRKYTLLKKYGISLEQYDELLEKQEGKCAVCGKTPEEEGRALAVDHDHKTGEIFGLLCFFCNHKIIGKFRNPELFFKAGKYLSKGTGLFVPEKKKRQKKKKRKA